MLPWPLRNLTEENLRESKANERTESQSLEYKRLMLGNTPDEKLELLKAVSAFANTLGGDLVLGIDAPDGVPTDIIGIPSSEIDKFKLKLESIVRDNLEP